MYNLHLSAEQLEIRETIHDFVRQVIKPVVLKADRLDLCDRSLPMDVLDQASQMGFRSLALSEDRGGAGADALTCCLATEELAAGDADIAAILTETSRLSHVLFDGAMDDRHRDTFLEKFLSDDRFHLAFADREPDTDSRLGINYHRAVSADGGLRTVAASATNDGWVINGTKTCVANAPVAGLFAVSASLAGRPGVVVLLAPADAPGLSVKAYANAWQHGAYGEVIFKDCHVPAANLLNDQAAVQLSASEADGRGVPLDQALNLGIGRAAYEAAVDYARLRVQGGRPLIEHQAIAMKLASAAINLEVARGAIWRAAWAFDHPEAVADRSLSDLPLRTMAHVFTSEAVMKITKDSAEVFGAMGVMRDMPLHKYIHDARVCLHSGDGNSEARLRLAEAIADHRRAPPAALALAGD
jgi:alkylation response protein AidB-like acyl-CoA dehydrogenase